MNIVDFLNYFQPKKLFHNCYTKCFVFADKNSSMEVEKMFNSIYEFILEILQDCNYIKFETKCLGSPIIFVLRSPNLVEPTHNQFEKFEFY